MDNKRGRFRRLAVWCALALALCAVGAALWRSGLLRKIGSVEELRDMIDQTGPWGSVVYFLLQMTTVIVAPIPSNVTMAAGALALGFWEATILGVLAVLTGSVLLFLAARRLGRGAVQRLLDRGVMEKYLPVIEEKQEMFLFLTMLFPFFPDDAMCILAGLTAIPLTHFVGIAVLGRPWGLVFAALLGSGRISLPLWGWVLLIPAMAGVFCLALRYSSEIESRLFELASSISANVKKRDQS